MHSATVTIHLLYLVMGGIENFLLWLLKDKIPQYHSKYYHTHINQYFTDTLYHY